MTFNSSSRSFPRWSSFLEPELCRVASGEESSGAPSRSSSEIAPFCLVLATSAKMSSSCFALLFFLEDSFGSVSGSRLSHLLVATTGAGVSHFDDLVSRLRSRLTTGEEELLIGTPSSSSDIGTPSKSASYLLDLVTVNVRAGELV